MTALYFANLRAADRVSVKPHASPVLHAINYLIGHLDEHYLTELRAFGGLQSYPSRTKDPDPVDFSTGSVGIGATASIWSALSRRYVGTHFGGSTFGRQIALVGDAELDEGAIWEALADPMVTKLGEVLWVVDLNRQSLDRVVPGVAAPRLASMFSAVGWQTITLKYGRRLRRVFAMPQGELLEQRIDTMSNEEYQHLLRTQSTDLRDGLASGAYRRELLELLDQFDDKAIAELLRDLGGHDLGDLAGAFVAAETCGDQPSVVLAYTIKGWRLPTEGHPGNHSALLTTDQWRDLGLRLGVDPENPWERFPGGSPEAALCAAAGERLRRPPPPPLPEVTPLVELGTRQESATSTQEALGRLLVELARSAPDVAARVVTVSPDVASSTNLGGWINRVGVWHLEDHPDWFERDRGTLVRWCENPKGQHIELGIAEVNLVGLLSELGTTWARDGQPLLPIGTLYDPFVSRALEPWSFGIYSGGQSILVGTPSGVTLASEGGAHQSVITPSIGLEQPQCTAWEPAFAQDLEWAMLSALAALGRPEGGSAYFRLSTRPVHQALAGLPGDAAQRERRRMDVLAGGYRMRVAAGPPAVTLVGMGAVMPEVLATADLLEGQGTACDVVCLTSADLVFRALQARAGLGPAPVDVLERLFSSDRVAPIVSVLDGHPHTLAFLAAVNGVPQTTLGVDGFGQTGDVAELYGHFGIDSATIAGAAWDLIDRS